MGGSQRLTRAIGKSRAMEMCLTGDFMDAEEAASRGLVSRVVPTDQSVDEALKIARKISK
jgi:enoyl-CoA hydratase